MRPDLEVRLGSQLDLCIGLLELAAPGDTLITGESDLELEMTVPS